MPFTKAMAVWRVFRSKPGVAEVLQQGGIVRRQDPNSNGNGACDEYGSVFFRNADAPLINRTPGGPFNAGGPLRTLGDAYWLTTLGEAGVLVSPASRGAYNTNISVALFEVHALSGDPADTWAAAPCYLQFFVGVEAAPIDGAEPSFVFPVPIPPATCVIKPGWDRALVNLNSTNTANQSIYIGFSSTEEILTTGPTGTITVNWSDVREPVSLP